MPVESVLKIIAYGAWSGGTSIDNSIYENKGMFFKGNILVNNETIEKRIGVRRRIVAPEDERIGVIALQNLLDTGYWMFMDFTPDAMQVIQHPALTQ